MNYEVQIKEAVEKFEKLLKGQLDRVERINANKEAVDFTKLEKITIGVCGGDGIGPIISEASEKVLRCLLEDEIFLCGSKSYKKI